MCGMRSGAWILHFVQNDKRGYCSAEPMSPVGLGTVRYKYAIRGDGALIGFDAWAMYLETPTLMTAFGRFAHISPASRFAAGFAAFAHA